MLQQASDGEGNLGYLMQDTTLKTQVNSLSSALDSLIAIRTVPIMENLSASSDAIATASLEIQDIVKQLNEKDGLVGALVGDSTVTNDLRTTLQNLNEGTYKFDENMEALQYSWPFKKFFRKKQKEKNK